MTPLLHNVQKNAHCVRGTTRVVFLIGRFAVKVPAVSEWRLFLLGLLANMQEVQWSAAGFPELCPVMWSIPGGVCLVMQRARTLTEAEFNALDIKSWLDRGDYVVPAELKPDSFGYLDGRLVAVDYGN